MITQPDATTEDVAQTLARYEALAISTGEWEGTDLPQFSADGETWKDFWLDEEPPALARASVRRRGVEPVVVVIAWREHVPAERDLRPDEVNWRGKWLANPMALFGSAALRRAYQRAFRDVIGEADRTVHGAPPAPKSEPAAAVTRDWDAELAAAADMDTLDQVWTDMKGVRTGAREVVYKARRREMVEESWTPADLAEVAGVSPEEAEQAITALAEAPKPGPARPATRDHLPPAGNRAERRAAARKNGRRK